MTRPRPARPRSLFALAVSFALALAAPPRAARAGLDDAALAEGARLDLLLRLALAAHPVLAAAALRAGAADEDARAAAGLPPPQLRLEQMVVPLDRPADLGRADLLSVGVTQVIPAWGTRAAATRAAVATRAMAVADARARRVALAADVRRAYAEYVRSHAELALHARHVVVTRELVDLARLAQRAGHGSQYDVLRFQLELSRLHADVVDTDQEHRVARARLNVLAGRAPDAPLGPPADQLSVDTTTTGGADAALAQRPDVEGARASAARAVAERDRLRDGARFPALTIGVSYQHMPMVERHGWGAMLMLDLPWLGGTSTKYREAAERRVLADARELDAVRRSAAYEIAAAEAQVAAAESGLRIVEDDLAPQAQRGLESARATYASGQGAALDLLDALRTYLEVEVTRVRARARLTVARADLAAAQGQDMTP